jgi:hypothetical protein
VDEKVVAVATQFNLDGVTRTVGKKKDLADLLTKIDELAASGAPIQLG